MSLKGNLPALAMIFIVARFDTDSAHAANFDRTVINGMNFVSLTGVIVEGDSEKFNGVAAGLEGPTVVTLNSEGGKIFDAMVIGESIRSKGFDTAVENDATCASACGLIWLAGTKRYIASAGRVGFHAAYTGAGSDARETGLGNAMVGAYLTKLGLSYSAIALVTAAHPDDMKWLHPSDAQQAGIEAVTLPASPSQPTIENVPTEPQRLPLEQRMINLTLSYYSAWSGTGANPDALTRYYSDKVEFYGSNLPRDSVMAEKRKFSVRWPIRHYSVNQKSIVARCSTICSVTGIVEWDVSSTARNAHSVGRANFELTIAANASGVGGVILSESGSVISNTKSTLSSLTPPLMPQNLTALLTQDQRRELSTRVHRCYQEDSTVPNYATYSALITVTVDADGVARDAQLSPSDLARANSDPDFRAFADRARRAVLDPACAKFPLPASALGQARLVTMRFRP